MPLLNPPLPELSHTDVNLYFDEDPLKWGHTSGQYLLEITFTPGYKRISPLPTQIMIPYYIPENLPTSLIDNFELTTAFENPDYQEEPLLILLGYSFNPDSIEPPQDKILLINFREMSENQVIEFKTKVIYYLSARNKPKRINYIENRGRTENPN